MPLECQAKETIYTDELSDAISPKIDPEKELFKISLDIMRTAYEGARTLYCHDNCQNGTNCQIQNNRLPYVRTAINELAYTLMEYSYNKA